MSRIPPFPFLVNVLLAGVLLTRTAFFLVWPFLSIILLRRFHMQPAEVGAILGVSAIAGSTTAFYLGNLSDRFGRRNVMVAGCLGSVVAFLILASADTVAAYIAGAILVGLCRSGIESPASALISDLIAEPKLRQLAFHTRYFLSNVGASVGPLAGFYAGLAAQQQTFWITGVAYLLFAVTLTAGFRSAPESLRRQARDEARLSQALRVLSNDHRFLMLVVANFLAYVAYAQVESTLVQYLNLDGGPAGLGIATAIIATNGITIILFQFPMLRLLRHQDLYVRTYIGIALFVCGFGLYALLPRDGYFAWIAATWILSVGEAILFPTLNLQADHLAPAHLRGSYFGAVTISNLGFAFGPAVGGALLQYIGGPLTFFVTALITVMGGLSYWLSSRLKTAIPQEAS